MKQYLILIMLAMATSAHANDIRSGNYPMDMTKNKVSTTSVTVIGVQDIDKACNQERVSKGYQKNKVLVDACSFWNGNQCTIYVRKTTNLSTLGHEFAHCLQGNWHND